VTVGERLDLLIEWLRARRGMVAAIASLVTVVLVTGVVLTMTSLGCSAGKSLGMRVCIASAARVASSSPTNQLGFGPVPASGSVPYQPPASAVGPYPAPVSAGMVPSFTGASGSQVPFFNSGSGANGAPRYSINCRLPIYAGGPGSGGFIAFPDGTFIADPRSDVHPSPAPSNPGMGYGNYGMWWDRTYSRWLPVGYALVSPDESRYAFPGDDGVYVHNVATGAQTELGAGRKWSVIDVEATGVYASEQGASGLWLLPFSGAPHQVASTGYWQAANASAAYGTPTSAVPSGASNTILRLDLKTGAITDWFTRQGAQSSAAGFDRSGNPIIYVNGQGGSEVWIVPQAGKGSVIAAYSYGPYGNYGFSPQGSPVADSHGIWFPGNGGIALYVSGAGLYWMSSVGGQIAGGCH